MANYFLGGPGQVQQPMLRTLLFGWIRPLPAPGDFLLGSAPGFAGQASVLIPEGSGGFYLGVCLTPRKAMGPRAMGIGGPGASTYWEPGHLRVRYMGST